MRALHWLAIATTTLFGVPAPPSSPTAGSPTIAPQEQQPRKVPFGPGERLVYDVSGKFSGLPIASGTGVMEVVGVETVRGREAYHIHFSVKGRALIAFKVEDDYESWIDTRTLASLRFWERIKETSHTATRKYEIFPDLRQFRLNDEPPKPSVANPLDEGSFVYFIRTMALTVGRADTIPQYFKPERNPVIVHVVRRERIKVAGREWDAIVVQPTILTSDKGLFSKDSHAEIWLSDNADHIVLKLRSEFNLKSSLTLTLKSFTPAPPR